MSAYGYIVGDGIQRSPPTNDEYMHSAFDQVFRQFRAQGGEEALSRRLQGKAQSRFDLLQYSTGPVFCHDDLQQERTIEIAYNCSDLLDFGIDSQEVRHRRTPFLQISWEPCPVAWRQRRRRIRTSRGFGEVTILTGRHQVV